MNDRQTREAAIVAEIKADQLVAQARRINQRILVAVLIFAALLVGFNWPKPADAATRIHGKVDVCVLSDTPRSWTKGLEKKANRSFSQRVDVHRRGEDHLGGCDAVVWVGGRRALDYVAGVDSSNPRFNVYTGVYAMAPIEINVGSVTPKKQRKATLVKALREGGVR